MGVPGSANLMLFGGAQAYEIEQSLRFNSADSAYLNRTPASAGNRKTWTWSGWVKRGSLGSYQTLFSGGGTSPSYDALRFDNNDKLQFFQQGAATTNLTTTAVFRDPSAWYHIVIKLNATASEAAVFVNGVEQTVTGTQPTNTDGNINNTIPHGVGATAVNSTFSLFSDAYLAEINFIDGSALTPSSFGETDPDTGAWIPKRYSGSYGTNGFYLNFSDNSGTTSTTLGKDSSGNGNNWTPNNFSVTAGTGNDVLSDTPTTNYATINPLSKEANVTLANGNLDANSNGSTATAAYTNFAISSGKWYAEITFTNTPVFAGIIQSNYVGGDLRYPGRSVSGSTSIGIRGGNGDKYKDGTATSYGSAFSANDVCGIALDMDNGKIWFSKNGTFFASGDPAAGTNAAYTTDIAGKEFCFAAGDNASASRTWTLNAGQRAFAYTPPTGFEALNTANLPEPTIKDGGKHFNTVLYTGTAASSGSTQSVAGVGFAPDLVWIKRRENANSHHWTDIVRGAAKYIQSNATDAEITTNVNGNLSSFDSDGFTCTYGSSVGSLTCQNGGSYVAWNWKADGTGSSNNAGTITSTVSANASAGFSIVTYTGTGSAATVGHGLGVAPKMVIVKRRTATTGEWWVYHSTLGATKGLNLNSTATPSTLSIIWNNTEPTSSVFSIGTGSDLNALSGTYVAYCFSEVAGYSKFGSYTGTNTSDNAFVYCGFAPAWILVKAFGTGGTNYDWRIYDNKRNTYNPVDNHLEANQNLAEDGDSRINPIDFLSNGFKIRQSYAEVGSNTTYIFAAFAELPFKYSTAR